MKHIFFIPISVTMACGSFYFWQTQASNFNKVTEIYQSLQQELKTIEDDLTFLKRHHQELSFLEKKGWFKPHSRLIAAEKIKKAAAPLNKINFIFEPETIKEEQKSYSFKVSKLVLETSALLDTHIYDFLENMLRNFPGILILRKVSITRIESLNEKSLLALRQHKRHDFMRAEIIFEWVSMGEKRDEE